MMYEISQLGQGKGKEIVWGLTSVYNSKGYICDEYPKTIPAMPEIDALSAPNPRS